MAIPGGGTKEDGKYPTPREIVAYGLNAKYIISLIFTDHASVYKQWYLKLQLDKQWENT